MTHPIYGLVIRKLHLGNQLCVESLRKARPSSGAAILPLYSWSMDYDRRHFGYLARYNRSANEQLIGHLALLPVSELVKPRGSYYGSIQGLLDHVFTSDMNWLRRIREFSSADEPLRRSTVAPAGTAWAACTFPHFNDYRRERAVVDGIIEDWIALTAGSHFGEVLAYSDFRGKPRRYYLRDALDHMFNHQTHHRGQVSQILDEMGVAHDFSNLILGAEIPAGS
jgi:uncharacterized damage-inducible protein DinB